MSPALSLRSAGASQGRCSLVCIVGALEGGETKGAAQAGGFVAPDAHGGNAAKLRKRRLHCRLVPRGLGSRRYIVKPTYSARGLVFQLSRHLLSD